MYLDVDKILAAIQNGDILAAIQNDDGSLSSDDSKAVSSVRSTNVIVPPFVIKACQKLPVNSLLMITPKPSVAEWIEDIQRAVLLVQPFMDSILIRL